MKTIDPVTRAVTLIRSRLRDGEQLEALAGRLGVSYRTVARWAAGQFSPTTNTARRVCATLEAR